MDNYVLWSQAIEVTLLGRNMAGFIDRTILLMDFWGNSRKICDWCNAIVISCITCNVSKELFSGIMYSTSAHQVSLDLKESSNKINGSRLYQLHRNIFTLTQGVSLSLLISQNWRICWMNMIQFFPHPVVIVLKLTSLWNRWTIRGYCSFSWAWIIAIHRLEGEFIWSIICRMWTKLLP